MLNLGSVIIGKKGTNKPQGQLLLKTSMELMTFFQEGFPQRIIADNLTGPLANHYGNAPRKPEPLFVFLDQLFVEMDDIFCLLW